MRRSSKVFSLRQMNIRLRNSCLFTDEKSDFQLLFSSACISSQLRLPNDFVFGSLSFNSKLNYLMPSWYLSWYLRLRCSLCYCLSLLNIEKKISWPVSVLFIFMPHHSEIYGFRMMCLLYVQPIILVSLNK